MARKHRCKHYRGMHLKEKCEAGVAFAELPHAGTKLFYDACPCFSLANKENCSKAEYRTQAEMDAEDAKIAKRFEMIGKARNAIVEHLGGPWKRGTPSACGAIKCPCCGTDESLQFSRSGYNGHIHARCKTDGCVAWME